MVDACSSNGNGQYCAESVGTDLTTNFVTDPYIIALTAVHVIQTRVAVKNAKTPSLTSKMPMGAV